jgi:hypothetical protein
MFRHTEPQAFRVVTFAVTMPLPVLYEFLDPCRQLCFCRTVEYPGGCVAAKENILNMIRRILKTCLLVLIGSAAAGCVVLPFGRGHDGYGRGGHHYASQSPGKTFGGADKETPVRGPR